MTTLIVTGDVEGKLQRLRFRSGQSSWWLYHFCDKNNICRLFYRILDKSPPGHHRCRTAGDLQSTVDSRYKIAGYRPPLCRCTRRGSDVDHQHETWCWLASESGLGHCRWTQTLLPKRPRSARSGYIGLWEFNSLIPTSDYMLSLIMINGWFCQITTHYSLDKFRILLWRNI